MDSAPVSAPFGETLGRISSKRCRRVLSHSGAHVLTFFFLPSELPTQTSFGAACIDVYSITVIRH